MIEDLGLRDAGDRKDLPSIAAQVQGTVPQYLADVGHLLVGTEPNVVDGSGHLCAAP